MDHRADGVELRRAERARVLPETRRGEASARARGSRRAPSAPIVEYACALMWKSGSAPSRRSVSPSAEPRRKRLGGERVRAVRLHHGLRRARRAGRRDEHRDVVGRNDRSRCAATRARKPRERTFTQDDAWRDEPLERFDLRGLQRRVDRREDRAEQVRTEPREQRLRSVTGDHHHAIATHDAALRQTDREAIGAFHHVRERVRVALVKQKARSRVSRGAMLEPFDDRLRRLVHEIVTSL